MNKKIVTRNSGISSIAAVVVVLVVLILTSGAVAISFNAISAGQHTSTLTLTVVNTTTAGAVSSSPTNTSSVSLNSSSSNNYWTPAAPMNVNRSFSAVATLKNGSVVVAGGFAGTVPNSSIASAEMYNPFTNKWTMIAPMHVGRAGALAITLNNGEILVTGGLGNHGVLTSCELYNVTTNTWVLTGNMSQARFDHQIVKLNDGRVLVVGGDFGGTENNATEIYTPSTGTWTTEAPQPLPRADMIAVKLPNGNVLVAGGHTSKTPTLLSAIFNPNENTWTPTGPLNTPHGDAGGVLLKNGDVLLAGGYTTYNDSDNTIQYLYTSELFNTTTNSWKMTGDLNFPRGETGLSIVLLNNGEVLFPGGNYQPETGQATAELYNPTTGKWSLAGTMSVARGSGAMSVLLVNGMDLTLGGLLPHTCTYCGSGKTGQDLATTSADIFNPNATSTITTTTVSASKGPGFQVEIPSGVGSSTSLSFSPENVTLVISVNNTVTWTNDDSVIHTVTSRIVPSGASSFNSNNMNPGAIFTYTFTVPGTYTYYCIYHAWMQGTIIVKSG